MGNYKTTRKQAAENLDMSVRSIDRYIKSGKIRSKKKGKIVYLHGDDVKNMGGLSGNKQHIIITEPLKKTVKSSNMGEEVSQAVTKKEDFSKITKTFETVYSDLRKQIETKDEIIQKLSIQVGQSSEQVKHSISISEHNRSQMLLEESRGHIAKQMTDLTDEKKGLKKQLNDEKFDKKVLIVFVFILLGVAAYFFFKNI